MFLPAMLIGWIGRRCRNAGVTPSHALYGLHGCHAPNSFIDFGAVLVVCLLT